MCVILVGASLPAAIVFVLVFGASYGAQTLARASVIVELFCSSHYGRISSVMSIFLTVATTAGPISGAALYDRFATYQPVLLLTIALAFSAADVIAWAKPDLHKRITRQTQELQHGNI